jgi:hypothetical protein
MTEANIQPDATSASNQPAAAPAADSQSAASASKEVPWYGDAALEPYVKNKGWQSPADVVQSYINAEKLIGRDPSTLVQLPAEQTPEAWAKVWDRLGRPKDPTGYDMKVGLPQGMEVDDAFASDMAKALHEAGVTKQQAERLVAAYNAKLAEVARRSAQEAEQAYQLGERELQQEWKGAYDRMVGLAKAAVRDLGIPPEAIDGIEAAIGYKDTIKLFAEIGRKLGEAPLATDERSATFAAMSPAEAKAAWESLKMDANFVKALTDGTHPGHKAAVEKQTRLFQAMVGG